MRCCTMTKSTAPKRNAFKFGLTKTLVFILLNLEPGASVNLVGNVDQRPGSVQFSIGKHNLEL